MTNPPIPPGYNLMKQLAVTPSMAAWAMKILRDPKKFPIFATTLQAFNGVTVLARVEWHSPDFQNHAVHRGVTLYASAQPGPNVALADGVDLSGYQPVVDFGKTAASGVAFAFIKATEGTTLVDRVFARHWAQARQAKLLRGAYHFFRPKQDAVAQAKFFLAQLSDPGELPPVLDVEVINGVAPAQIVDGVDAWIDVVAGALGRPIIYTSPSFWNALPTTADLAGKADLWVAHWGARTPAGVNGWQRWTFWQFTNKASVAGIAGDVDMDQFNGSLAALRTYSAEFVSARPRCSP
ncbi:MAG TPA: GH25 family lysozyme [Polyangiaceae bacterium]|nr:GH25 family lysozyme [Polyangiaceae bacterium]